MLRGLFFAGFACLLWGITYVVPAVVSGFSPSEILLGRYLVFGLLSFFLLLRKKHRGEIETKTLPSIKIVIALALFGFLLYDLLEIANLRVNGSEAVSLIYGATLLMCPVFMRAISQKKWPAWIDWINFFIPLFGLILLEWDSKEVIFQGNWTMAWGIAITQAVLAVYFTRNMAAFTKGFSNPEQTAENITLLIGTTCLCLSLVGWSYYIVGIEGSLIGYLTAHSLTDWVAFISISLFSGIGTTWLATHLWCIASLRVPYQWLANFMLADIVAGKIYELVISEMAPSWVHIIAIGVIFGRGIVIHKIGGERVDGEDPELADIAIVSQNVDPGILSPPLIEAQVASSEA